MSDIYLLDWTETRFGKQPKPDDVDYWFRVNGYEPDTRPKVYANGTVQIELPAGTDEAALRARWQDFEPVPLTPEDQLGAYVRAVVDAKARLEKKKNRTETDDALLAVIALLMYGYGVQA